MILLRTKGTPKDVGRSHFARRKLHSGNGMGKVWTIVIGFVAGSSPISSGPVIVIVPGDNQPSALVLTTLLGVTGCLSPPISAKFLAGMSQTKASA